MTPTPLSNLNKTSVTADWLLPLLLWLVVMGIVVSLVVAALSSAVS